MIREILEKAIKTALWELEVDETKIPKMNLEHPEDISHGDYFSNIAMILAKQVAQNPRELAEKIVEEINERRPKEIKKIEVAGPGFINFFLADEFFAEKTREIVKMGENFGQNRNLKGQKTIIEYTDPNPFKEFHIGHLMSNSIGEAVSRIVEANGAKVKRACYQGDVGLHVAKTVWAIKENKIRENEIAVDVLGRMYKFGSVAYEKDERSKKEIVETNRKIYDRSRPETNKIYDLGRKISLEYFEKMYKILGTKFDFYFFENETGGLGKKIIEKDVNGIFEKSDGATIFRGEKYNLHTRVFINSEGLPTYEAKDLALAKIKFDKFKYDKSIVVTGNEINDYFKVILKVMGLIFPEFAEKTTHLSHGMLRLPTGKMSSRTGDVITATSLLEEVRKKVSDKMVDREIGQKEKQEISEKVSVGALKYSILKQIMGKDIIFDFEKSLSFEGDSGPYLQYSYARARSVLRKAKEEKISEKFKKRSAEVFELERLLYRFREIVERAGREYAPNHIATYLIQIASSFNSFYSKNKIVDKTDPRSSYKIFLTEAFVIVLKNGLNLLGIEAPEKM